MMQLKLGRQEVNLYTKSLAVFLLFCSIQLHAEVFSPIPIGYQQSVPSVVDIKLPAPKIVTDPNEDIIYELQLHLVLDVYSEWASDLNWSKLRQFYAKRDFLPVWQSPSGVSARAKVVRDMLVFSDREGLEPHEYHTTAIQFMWRAKRARSKARLELLLTDAFLRYSVEVSVGYQYPRAADSDWHVMPSEIDPLEQLERFLTADEAVEFIDNMPPPHRAYARLKSSLAYYRILGEGGNWPRIPRGPQLQIGMDHEQVPLLRARLFREEYLSLDDNLTSTLFDETLDIALKAFQSNYGHKVDGIVGRSTRKSLNVSLPHRINIIKQNMERWRWIPRQLGERYVIVNMAGYNLDYVEKGKSIINMPVIVGEPYRATPAFVDTLKYLELNPTWSVPPRIAKEKFLPKVQKDLGFLKRNHLKVFDSWRKDANEVDPAEVDWNKLTDRWFPYKLEQTPGKHNNMGLIKFMFPNRFRVYLHDTPNRKLFDRYVRTFSAGCIRVADPFDLAKKILKNSPEWGGADFSSILASGETTKIDLEHDIPVYLLYWTAWVDEHGKVNFRRDVYQRDKKIATGGELDFS